MTYIITSIDFPNNYSWLQVELMGTRQSSNLNESKYLLQFEIREGTNKVIKSAWIPKECCKKLELKERDDYMGIPHKEVTKYPTIMNLIDAERMGIKFEKDDKLNDKINEEIDDGEHQDRMCELCKKLYFDDRKHPHCEGERCEDAKELIYEELLEERIKERDEIKGINVNGEIYIHEEAVKISQEELDKIYPNINIVDAGKVIIFGTGGNVDTELFYNNDNWTINKISTPWNTTTKQNNINLIKYLKNMETTQDNKIKAKRTHAKKAVIAQDIEKKSSFVYTGQWDTQWYNNDGTLKIHVKVYEAKRKAAKWDAIKAYSGLEVQLANVIAEKATCTTETRNKELHKDLANVQAEINLAKLSYTEMFNEELPII